METEVQVLREKERELRGLLVERDGQISKQKNEWAEIYGSMKQEIEAIKHENKALLMETDKLQRDLANGGGAANRQMEKELAKKLKKRELECQALWDTLKDM